MKSTTEKYTLLNLTGFGAKKKISGQQALFDYFFPELSESAEVLEIGSGRGDFAFECRRRNLRYFGIEPSQKLRRDLETEPGICVIDQVVPPIRLESNRFDLVHSFDFVEHLCTYHEVMSFFLESYRVLKPGGYVSVIAPNYRTIKHLFFQYEYQHSYVTTLDRLENMVKDSGFELSFSMCFLLWIAPRMNWLDRLVASFIIPIGTNMWIECLIRNLTSPSFLFRAQKNLFDHVAILARKPKAT